MYHIDGCVNSPLIQYMCKSIQFSFDNCKINTVYSFTLKLKWLGKGLPSLTKKRSYIKNRCILGIQAKDIFNDICRVYGNNELSFSSVTRWCKKFKSGVDSIEDVPHACRPKTATSQKIVEK